MILQEYETRLFAKRLSPTQIPRRGPRSSLRCDIVRQIHHELPYRDGAAQDHDV